MLLSNKIWNTYTLWPNIFFQNLPCSHMYKCIKVSYTEIVNVTLFARVKKSKNNFTHQQLTSYVWSIQWDEFLTSCNWDRWINNYIVGCQKLVGILQKANNEW